MKKYRYIIFAVIAVAAIIVTLVNNKAKLQAKSKVEVKESYFVSVEKAAVRQLTEEISFVGTISANNDVAIISETQGKVTGVFAKVGDYKQAGSVLVQVDDELKKAAYSLAEANYLKAKKDYERFKSLFEQKSVSEAQLDQAKVAFSAAESQYIVARRQLNDTKITTPVSGIVTQRNADIGTMTAPGMNIANVVDISRLKVKVSVSEQDVFRLKPGGQVVVTTEVYPGKNFAGRIETVGSKGDESHTYPVEISMSNDAKNPLKAGMFGRVHFSSLDRTSALAIPRVAVVGSIKDSKVFVIENGMAVQRSITLGDEFGTFVEVLGGIREGEQVVVSGQNTLLNNVKVSIVE